MSPKRKNIENLTRFGKERPTLPTELAKEYGSRGGRKAKENYRRKIEMREAFSVLESLPTTGKLEAQLERMGIPEEDRVGSVGIIATLYAMAMRGDKAAIKMWLDYQNQDAERRRKDDESKARISAMANGDVNVSSGDDDGRVQIYLPAIDSEEELSVKNKLGEKKD